MREIDFVRRVSVVGLALIFVFAGCALSPTARRNLVIGGVASTVVGAVVLVHTANNIGDGDGDAKEEFGDALVGFMGGSLLMTGGLVALLVGAFAPSKPSQSVDSTSRGRADSPLGPQLLTCPPGYVLVRTPTPGGYQCALVRP